MWTCSDCPPARPPPSSTPTTGGLCFDRFACRYDPDTGLPSEAGPLTCSCGACGRCPAERPPSGAACDDARLACSYGDEICACDAAKGWTCVTPACPAHPGLGGMGGTNGVMDDCGRLPKGYVCRYAGIDQSCSCSTERQVSPTPHLFCSCPAALPAEGSACLGTSNPCAYPGWSCACTAGPDGGRWHCAAVCPPGPPLNGPCKDRLVCDYQNFLRCTCDGVAWSCS